MDKRSKAKDSRFLTSRTKKERSPRKRSVTVAKPSTIRVLTYNISWATALGKAIGSEAEFVKDKCFRPDCKESEEGGVCERNVCRDSAIRSLLSIPSEKRPHVIGFQEFRVLDRNLSFGGIEGTSKLWKLSSTEKLESTDTIHARHILSCKAGEAESYMAACQGVIDNKDGKLSLIYSGLMTAWNASVLGRRRKHACVNIRTGDDARWDLRPIYLCLTDRRYLLVNVQAPWTDNYTVSSLTDRISVAAKEAGLSSSETSSLRGLFLFGDFNDDTADDPSKSYFKDGILLFGRRLPPPVRIFSCCYATSGSNVSPSSPGEEEKGETREDRTYKISADYVLSSLKRRGAYRVREDGSLDGEEKRTTSYSEDVSLGRSDHEPVLYEFASAEGKKERKTKEEETKDPTRKKRGR